MTVVEPGFGTSAGCFEILRDELTVTNDSSFVHSMITWPQGEFDIKFMAVEVTVVPADGDQRMALYTRQEQ